MIIKIKNPAKCPKCKEWIMPMERTEKIPIDFNKDLYDYYHPQCLRENKQSLLIKDPNQKEMF